jgi:hypothetical protein
LEWERVWQQPAGGPFWQRLKDTLLSVFSRRNLSELLQITTIGTAVTFLYCGSDWKNHPQLIHEAQSLPEGPGRTAAVWLAEHLRVFNNAGVGLSRQMQHNVQGHPTYLLGHAERRAIWYYFPLALSMKLSAPLLVVFIFCFVFRPQALWSAAGCASLCLLLFSLTCRVQIGIRLMLPIVALLAITAAAAVVRAWPKIASSAHRKLAAGTFVAAMIIWMNWSAWNACPNGICFVNEFWGGPRDGYLLLSDSNYDWGQGLNELAQWQQKEQLPVLDVWYFGTDPRILKPPFHVLQIHTLPITNADELRAQMRGRYLAAGTSVLYGGYCQDPAQQELFQHLRERRPIARTSTFLIYDLSPEAPAPDEHPPRLAQRQTR